MVKLEESIIDKITVYIFTVLNLDGCFYNKKQHYDHNYQKINQMNLALLEQFFSICTLSATEIKSAFGIALSFGPTSRSKGYKDTCYFILNLKSRSSAS